MAIAVTLTIIAGAFMISRSNDVVVPGGAGGNTAAVNNVSVVDGVQVIEIRAKGGYLPRKSVAQAGVPTVVRFNTEGTYDCSASVRIPSLKVSMLLSPSGSTDIDIGSPALGILRGSCGMGMYPFEIDFKG